MTGKKNGDKSKSEKGVRVVSNDDEKLVKYYGKPVTLYSMLADRSRSPWFLARSLSYRVEAKKNKTMSGGDITFNYMDWDNNNTILRYEVVMSFYCPFCAIQCGSDEGLKFHLTLSHDLFEYKFMLSKKDPEIDVSLKPEALKLEELSDDLEKHNRIPFTYFSLKRRKLHQSNNVMRPKLQFLEMNLNELPRDIENVENEVSHVNNGHVASPARAHSPEKTNEISTVTQPAIAQSSEPAVPRVSRRKMLHAKRLEIKRVENLKKRVFYHSKTLQPMSFEEVISDVDSETEVDDVSADIEEHLRLDQLVNVSGEDKRFMWLWNTFIRKQRVVADGHVPWACEEFAKLHVKELISPSGFWQWKMFTIKLWNHGLISAETMNKCNTFLLKAQEEAATAAASISQAAAAAAPSTSQAAATASIPQEAASPSTSQATKRAKVMHPSLKQQ